MAHDTPFDNSPSGMVQRWMEELRQADKSERHWRERSREIVSLYRDDDQTHSEHRRRSERRYNVLWSNTETLKPQLFSQTPEPVVQRRFHDFGQQDQVGKFVAQTLERGLDYLIDSYDFNGTIDKVILDHLLTGRGVARIRYVPTFAKGEAERIDVQQKIGPEGETMLMADRGSGEEEVSPMEVMQDGQGNRFIEGEADEEVVYEEVRCEYVNWEDFRLSPARTWNEVRWVAFRHRMTKEELRDEFGSKAEDVTLDFNPQDNATQEDSDEQHVSRRATVWEIWDKHNREVKFIAEGKKDAPIEVRDDPLNLDGFFPIPEPLYSVPTNNTMVPIPEYTLYQDQAIELDRVTTRIDRLIEALKARGLYAGEQKAELERLMGADENELIPVEDFSTLQGGKLEDKIAWMPIEQVAKTILELRRHREELLQVIYQVTGISDIMRGQTDPRETRGAQQLKGQFGVMRMQPRQRRVQKFIRDLLAMKAEVMAELFEPQTLQVMTGVQQPEQVTALLQNEALRGFKIDIETDSTIAADEQAEKEQMAEFFQGMSQFIQNAVPAFQTGLMSQEAAQELVKFALKKFRVSRTVEEAFETQPQQQQQQPDPVEMARVQIEKQKAQTERMKAMSEMQERQQKMQLEMAKLQQNRQEAEDENERHAIDASIDLIKEQEQTFRDAIATITSEPQNNSEESAQ